MKNTTIKITEDDFNDYKEVQESGMTNMFEINNVMELSGLEKDVIVEIMKNYGTYEKQFNG